MTPGPSNLATCLSLSSLPFAGSQFAFWETPPVLFNCSQYRPRRFLEIDADRTVVLFADMKSAFISVDFTEMCASPEGAYCKVLPTKATFVAQRFEYLLNKFGYASILLHLIIHVHPSRVHKSIHQEFFSSNMTTEEGTFKLLCVFSRKM